MNPDAWLADHMEDAIVVIPLDTPERREACASLALMSYSGERCRFCHETIEGEKQLRDVVYAGSSEYGRIAHKACWDSQPAETIAAIKSDIEAQR